MIKLCYGCEPDKANFGSRNAFKTKGHTSLANATQCSPQTVPEQNP
ncbi:hypothetical protein JCM19240_5026 [Vibrio maritimus]|uniref:Uncharacterized protein n=1 Tax=Vibrio maritimus TaxID=990268 RepID=A0A090SV16_9VIBR|nr:hypothetical protein JCM19240_5026 [Vibrio maritimus]